MLAVSKENTASLTSFHAPLHKKKKKKNSKHHNTSEVTTLFNNAIGSAPIPVRVRVTLQLTVSQSVSLGVEPNLGLLTRDIFFSFFF
jgi:hypothetical protein